MQIKSVLLKNFRGYESETRIDLNDLTVFVGKNDAGKSTILEALDIFFNEGSGVVKPDKDDVNVNCRAEQDFETVITVIFKDLPDEIILDKTVPTTLAQEYLLNEDNCLEISKKYNNGGKPKVWIRAFHPTNSKCRDLLLKKNSDLKKIIEDNAIPCPNKSVNSIMRQSIWKYFEDELELANVEIDASKEDARQIWEKLYAYMPVYNLFQSDRSNSDNDSEIQDPLKKAVDVILKEPAIQELLNQVADQVHNKLKEVSDRTLEKLKEVNEAVANELNPVIPSVDKLKWSNVFKSVSITGDDDIPINKRGSGVKRLILLSFSGPKRRGSPKKVAGQVSSMPLKNRRPPNTVIISAF